MAKTIREGSKSNVAVLKQFSHGQTSGSGNRFLLDDELGLEV